MEYEQMLVINEVSEILRAHNEALGRLNKFKEAYPYLVAPNLLETLEHNLKDNIAVLYREYQTLHNKEGKKYEKKYVCKRCKQVFFISLPQGLCDKCRAEISAPDTEDS